jgi:DNA-binding NarL/FixJ family response regulator
MVHCSGGWLSQHIYEKLHVRSRIEAVLKFLKEAARVS